MNTFASLKQVSARKLTLRGELRPLAPIFKDAIGTGNLPLGEGRLLLPPGTYLIAFTLVAWWRHAEELEVKVVVGGDTRFVGPKAVAESEIGAAELHEKVEKLLIHTGLAVRPKQTKNEKIEPLTGWDKSAVRTLSSWGIIAIPATGEAAVPVELTAEVVEDPREYEVTFENAELLAVQLNSAGSAQQ